MLTSQDVASVTFPIVKWRVGYEIDEVGALLAEVRETLAGYERSRSHMPTVSSAGVVEARFNPTKFREGWDQDAVDDYLEQIVSTLRAYEPS